MQTALCIVAHRLPYARAVGDAEQLASAVIDLDNIIVGVAEAAGDGFQLGVNIRLGRETAAACCEAVTPAVIALGIPCDDRSSLRAVGQVNGYRPSTDIGLIDIALLAGIDRCRIG